MGRLTRRQGKHSVTIGPETRRHDEVWLKLCHYEDLEEQGRLIELPCKVGDTVYYVNHSTEKIDPFVVYYFEMNKFTKEVLLLYAGNEKNKQHSKRRILMEYFEKHFCTTKEEAEAKLKELKGGAE